MPTVYAAESSASASQAMARARITQSRSMPSGRESMASAATSVQTSRGPSRTTAWRTVSTCCVRAYAPLLTRCSTRSVRTGSVSMTCETSEIATSGWASRCMIARHCISPARSTRAGGSGPRWVGSCGGTSDCSGSIRTPSTPAAWHASRSSGVSTPVASRRTPAACAWCTRRGSSGLRASTTTNARHCSRSTWCCSPVKPGSERAMPRLHRAAACPTAPCTFA